MKTSITTNEFVAEAKAGHESALLKPEYGTERAQEENAFDSSKCNHLIGVPGIGWVAPFESPVVFVLNAWHCFNCTE